MIIIVNRIILWKNVQTFEDIMTTMVVSWTAVTTYDCISGPDIGSFTTITITKNGNIKLIF